MKAYSVKQDPLAKTYSSARGSLLNGGCQQDAAGEATNLDVLKRGLSLAWKGPLCNRSACAASLDGSVAIQEGCGNYSRLGMVNWGGRLSDVSIAA